MEFLDLMKQRYTTKQYDASKKLKKEDVEKLKQILQLSPSSLNSQPWKFTFVSDQATKEILAEHSMHNADRVIKCDTVVAFSRIDDLAYFEEQINRELPQRQLDYYYNKLKPKPIEEVKNWFSRQLHISLGVFVSACAMMGIDHTPMGGIVPEQYNKILGLDSFHTDFAVCIGYRDDNDFNQPHLIPKKRVDLDKIIQSI